MKINGMWKLPKVLFNGRFGVMAVVVPRTILCGNERLYPAGSLVGAATTPSRGDVICKRDRAVGH